MTTYTPPQMRQLAATGDHPALLQALLTVGSDRLEDERAGGRILASFGDWCWRTNAVRDPELFVHWYTDVYDGPEVSDQDLDRAIDALGGRDV